MGVKFNAVHLSRILIISLIMISIIFPSGSIFSINIKLILASMVVFFYIYLVATRTFDVLALLVFLGFLAFIYFFSLVAVLNDVPLSDISSQAQAFFAAFSVCYFPLYFFLRGVVSKNEILLTIIYSLVVVCLIKLVVQVLLFLNIVSLYEIKSSMEAVFGVSFIGLDAGAFYRINFPVDYLIPVLLFALVRANEFNLEIKSKARTVLLGFLTMSLVFTYSRYLWVYGFIALLFAFFIKYGPQFRSGLFVIGILIIGVFVNSNSLIGFISERFAGRFSSSSDYTRVLMEESLLNTIPDAFLLGRGLGAGVPNYINIEAVPWYFELQWLGFVMQFGVIGTSVLFIFVFMTFVIFVKRVNSVFGIPLLGLYLLWLSVGLFNGFMLTSAGGIVFLTFFVLGRELSERGDVKRLIHV